MSKEIQYRIRKLDDCNWVVERFDEGGGIAKRGRTAGQVKASRWVNEGYFAQLKFAAMRLPDIIVGEILAGQEEVTGKQILAAIQQAETRALKIVEEALATPPKAG